MDIFSHGLYGGATFGQKSKKNFWWSFMIGMSPDLFSFGIFTLFTWLGLEARPDWSGGHPDQALIPVYVHTAYNITHSLIIFLTVFLLVWFLRKKPFWLLGAWGLHILIDIPSHSSEFFPTPFLWPVSNFHIDGISWGNPTIFIPNLILLGIIYTFVLFRKIQARRATFARNRRGWYNGNK